MFIFGHTSSEDVKQLTYFCESHQPNDLECVSVLFFFWDLKFIFSILSHRYCSFADCRSLQSIFVVVVVVVCVFQKNNKLKEKIYIDENARNLYNHKLLGKQTQ